ELLAAVAWTTPTICVPAAAVRVLCSADRGDLPCFISSPTGRATDGMSHLEWSETSKEISTAPLLPAERGIMGPFTRSPALARRKSSTISLVRQTDRIQAGS